MQGLPSAKVQEMARLLAGLYQGGQLADLVLVFSQSDTDRYLLVYNADPPADLPWPGCQTLRLADLQPDDHIAFDGPIVGMPAVDVLLPEIPTHGVGFCTIERLLPAAQPLLRRTAFRLAGAILAHLDRLSEAELAEVGLRGRAKVVQSALPYLLAERPTWPAGLALPRDLHALLADGLAACDACFELAAGDSAWRHLAERALGRGQWLVALEELALFLPALAQADPPPIELRPILRRAGGGERLRALLHGVARRAWRLWAEQGAEDLRAAAYALALEADLQAEDAGDLVACLPHADLEHFIARGDAVRLYRIPRPDLAGPAAALTDWLAGRLPVPADYGPLWFTFPPLRSALARADGRRAGDLGPVLWKAGLGAELARTFWLLSRDLLQGGEAWRSVGATPAQITDLAIRATLLYSLDDPWQWRQGRYPLFLDQCYGHLLNCLLYQEQTCGEHAPEAHYYRGLRTWYGCYATEDLAYSLSSTAHALRAYLDAAAASSESGDAAARRLEYAERLLEVCDSLIHGDFEVGRRLLTPWRPGRPPFELGQYLRSFVDTEAPVKIPSPPFEHQLAEYWALHTEWRRLQTATAADRPSWEQLDDLLRSYQRRRRVIHVPAHEQVLLARSYDADIAAIKRLQQAMEAGPVIRLSLRTPWVVRGVRENLRLDIENRGTAAAQQFELELLPSGQYSAHGAGTRLALEEFPPGLVRPLQIEVQTQEPTLTLNIGIRYRDRQGELHSEQTPLTVEVRPASERRWAYIESPYEAGIAVFGPQRFFGRQRELIEIFARLIGGITQPIMLRGPRRMGKTSVLRQVAWLLNHPDELALLGLTPEQITRLAPIRPAIISLQSLSESAGRATAQFFEIALQAISAALGERDGPLPEMLSRNPVRAFNQQIGIWLDRYPGTRLLVIVDEWDEIRRREFSSLERNLRSVMLEEQRVNWIVSSTWALSQEVRRYGSPFYNMCHAVEVREVDWESAVSIVTRPAERVGLDWHGEAVVAALELTGRRPYLIQLLGSAIVDYLNSERQSRTVTTDVVTAVAGRFVRGQTPTASQHFNFIWPDERQPATSEDAVRWLGRLILWALDCAYPVPLSGLEIKEFIRGAFYKHGFTSLAGEPFDDEFDDQMTLLEKIFDVISTTGDKRYFFSVGLVRNWFHNRLPPEADLMRQAHAGLLRDISGKG